jgi:hypothetical protein
MQTAKPVSACTTTGLQENLHGSCSIIVAIADGFAAKGPE